MSCEIADRIVQWLRDDDIRWHLLDIVRSLDLPDCWIAAGFIRNMVWDRLHQRTDSPIASDVDVIWYDQSRADGDTDRDIEALLRDAEPLIDWSVKNQARMHLRNNDAPYNSAIDAMRYWPETATAVAARRSGMIGCDISAPLGLQDLAALRLRPTPRFTTEKLPIYAARTRDKDWMGRWPGLRVVADCETEVVPISSSAGIPSGTSRR
jgi:hypothetical protein